MAPAPEPRALVVRGGWDGHAPKEATERFIPFLEHEGFQVDVSEDVDVYLDEARMRDTDLVVQCWTMGTITDEQAAGLIRAVERGTGLAGWHGGIADSFRNTPEYLQLVGGIFATHPGGYVDYEVEVVPDRRDHELVSGLPERWAHHTEQYWVLACPMNDVLVTTRFTASAETPWREDVTMPAVWTRRWVQGRVFVSTIGHFPTDLDVPPVRTMMERALLWTSR
jgi:uncharacterized protein